ncbi:MAG TPA: tyrosine-type recombinase/integrase [Methanofastidiosum sp.]|nr:tyrosine-type recombinase/integrase [Methanofastidiosum sp.]HQG60868.1 tyrosine-type recombinase/integrase [Methanofastidiosum sp.]HQK84934.1 tyrosine-type recombinase/integrase [Methanofastidiosum sp.]
MDIHKGKIRYENQMALLDKSNICEENKTAIKEFKSYLIATRIGLHRTIKYMSSLRLVCERYNDKPFSEWGLKDTTEVLEKIEMLDISLHTKNEFQKGLRRFFKWYKGEKWEGIEPLRGNRRVNRKPDILTNDEVFSLIDSAKHPRDKAMISLLYEGGFRIGELASIKFKDIEFNKFGGKVKVSGKTGERLVPFVFSESYIKNWMQMHPCPGDDTDLFVGLGMRNYGKPLYYDVYSLVLKKAVKNAGLKKKITPHLLRHARATHLASKLTESEMCHYLGWQMGSDMPRIYVHLSGRDIDKAIYNKVYGFETDEKKEKESLKPLICPRCKENCGPTSEYCYRCGMTLEEDKIFEMEKHEKELKKFFFECAEKDVGLIKDLNIFLEMIEIVNSDPDLKERIKEETRKIK